MIVPACDRQTDGQSTALCIEAMLTRGKNALINIIHVK